MLFFSSLREHLHLNIYFVMPIVKFTMHSILRKYYKRSNQLLVDLSQTLLRSILN